MYAVFIILNNIEKLDDILTDIYEEGCGATTLDSEGMGKVLLEHHVDIPIFAGMRRLVEGNKPYNKTVISIIKDEKKLRKVVDTINEKYVNGTGIMFVMPVLECYGLRNEEYENY